MINPSLLFSLLSEVESLLEHPVSMTISDKIIDKYLFHTIFSLLTILMFHFKKEINLKKILTIKYPNMAKTDLT